MPSSSDESDRKMPAVSGEEFNQQKKKKRNSRAIDKDRKTSMKRKKSNRHEKAWLEYCKFMNNNLEKKSHYHESPHIVVCKSLHLICENSIILLF